MRRHDRVTLRRDAPFSFACGAADPALTAAVRNWIAAGRPLVAARQPADSHEVQLGLTLPTHLGRQRLACRVERQAVVAIAPPLTVDHCLHRLPAATAQVLARLAERCAEADIVLGVFGSLAWEATTGESYRHVESDIDLIADVTTHGQYRIVLAALVEAAGALPCRLDGELRFPDGNAVAWRELVGAGDDPHARVLAKGPSAVALLPVATLVASLQEPAHA